MYKRFLPSTQASAFDHLGCLSDDTQIMHWGNPYDLADIADIREVVIRAIKARRG